MGQATPAATLAAALQPLTGLTCLCLDQMINSATGMVVIAPALMGMRRLQVLQLRINLLSAQGTAAFAAAVPALAS